MAVAITFSSFSLIHIFVLYFYFIILSSIGGCSYTPECYYINIRTGTHYFPKGVVHPLGIDNGNRFKCGLNRIDEKQIEYVPACDDKVSDLLLYVGFWDNVGIGT